jgi:predicted metal-dependent enzyme (double-stranded beta helix superfamily)
MFVVTSLDVHQQLTPEEAVPRLWRALEGALADRQSWEHLVRHDPTERVCELLRITDEVELWLVCWSRGHDTGFHDHHSTGLITVIAGAIREERLVLHGSPILRSYSQGSSVTVPAGDIHRVTYQAGVPAITLHAYSPPLERVGTYLLGDDGRLRRHIAPADAVLASATRNGTLTQTVELDELHEPDGWPALAAPSQSERRSVERQPTRS